MGWNKGLGGEEILIKRFTQFNFKPHLVRLNKLIPTRLNTLIYNLDFMGFTFHKVQYKPIRHHQANIILINPYTSLYSPKDVFIVFQLIARTYFCVWNILDLFYYWQKKGLLLKGRGGFLMEHFTMHIFEAHFVTFLKIENSS